ncbi:MAG: polyprenyl synthetase family protein [Myxococcota bacterium]
MTKTIGRIEQALQGALNGTDSANMPPKLARALHYAVFPGGARVRPQLCLAVASACGDDAPDIADASAAAIELLHCASLVHDDLPCFDDAPTRRGRPSVHRAFGEAAAVLAGDALIVMAFETLARASAVAPERLTHLSSIIGRAAGAPCGLVAGQGWELESDAALESYHQAKTGALFVAATTAGAIAAGAEAEPWQILGARLGAAYQVADDIRDVAADPDEIGKPVLQDAQRMRPNAVATLGLEGALARLQQLLQEAVDSIPECIGEQNLRDLVDLQAKRLVPKGLRESAA